MALQHSKKERYFFANLLTGLIKEMEGFYTVIDLRNESSVTGKIALVDGFMNIDLEDAVFYNSYGEETKYESFFIRSRLIRYVHIPEEMNIIDTIKGSRFFQKKRKRVENQKKSYKQKRALARQKETLQEIASTSRQ